jgi:hypothetical protein
LKEAVTEFTHALVLEEDETKQACANNDTFIHFRDAFIEAAQPDLE